MRRPKAQSPRGPKARSANAGSIRIIGGQWRGRKIPVIDIEGLRPTGDRVKETLFNWLAPYIDGACCLDMFAGSGSLGFEALSRGAQRVVALEASADAARALAQAAQSLEAEAMEVVCTDALQWVGEDRQKSFDLIFLDPPFGGELLGKALATLSRARCIEANALIYIETASDSEDLQIPSNWQLEKQKTAGAVRFALYRALAHDDSDVSA